MDQPKKRGRGRPKLVEGESVAYMVKVSADEAALIDRAADVVNTSRRQFTREATVKAANAVLEKPAGG